MIIGIDLGTSNSLAGIWRDGRHELIPNALGRLLTPSAVTVLENGEISVGEAARDRLLSHPKRTAAGFKRYMGSDRAILLAGRGFRPEELSALVLKSLKADAETYLGQRIEEAVITVPAYFNDTQRKATKAAGELAGLRVERLLNEPTAAALAYGLDSFRETGAAARILVVDLGGGTFDVSILEMFDGIMEVRATAGDNFLGGEDFVDVIVDAFIEKVGKAAGIPPRQAGEPFAAADTGYVVLRRQAELAKRTLSESDHAVLDVPIDGKMVSWTIDQELFQELSQPLLKRLRNPLAQAIKDARLAPEDLTQIVMAGGATRMPIVRKMIARMFGRLPAQNINPDEVVARGAAVQAGLKMQDRMLDEVVLTDVSPFSLGIETSRARADGTRISGLFSPILERNTVIPASRISSFYTVQDGQSVINIEIYQGEARLVQDNIHLGGLKVPLPRRAAGEEGVTVRFTYDVSGLLEVEVTVVSTGETYHKVIEGNPGVLTAAQIEARRLELAKLKVHPRDQAENLAVLAQAERLFEESLGPVRVQISGWIGDFTEVLDRQDHKEIELHRRAFADRLTEIDRDPFA
jgi:molecular chaperone HscC